VISGIPNIAYTIPDLEALATLQVTDVNSGDVVGCIQMTLTNGNTAYQPAVRWAMVGLALLALFSSLLHSVIVKSTGAAQWRVIDVMLAIQLPAIASLLSLNYPTVFIEYGINFAWSIGLVHIRSLQDSITKTRSNTGGHQSAIFGPDLIAQVATRLDPYSSNSEGSTSSSSSSTSSGSLHLRDTASSSRVHLTPTSSYATIKYPALQARQQYAPNTGPGGQLIGAGANISYPVVTSSPNHYGGIGTFAERLYIAPANAFLTVLTSMMILLAIFIAALIVVYLVAIIFRAISKPAHMNSSLHWSQRVVKPGYFISTIALATMGRYLMITFPIFFIFAFYQWDFGDSWVGHLVAAIFLVIFLAFAVGLFFPMIRHARRTSSDDLYYDEKESPTLHKSVSKTWGQMAHMYRSKFYWFSSVFLGYSIIRACFISFAQNHGTRQAIGLLVLEVLLFLTLCIFRVGRDKKSDFVFILLCFSRIATWAVCIAFIPSANVQTIPRVIVGFVLLVVTALPILFLFFLTIYDLISPFISILWRRRKQHRQEKELDNEKNNTTADSEEDNTEDRQVTEDASLDSRIRTSTAEHRSETPLPNT
jgi:hypothetical protein